MAVRDIYDVPVDRCVLGTAMLVSISGATAGITMWFTVGYSQIVLILLCSCCVVSALILIGLALSRSRTRRSSPTTPAPALDLPPAYRNTWRLEFAKKIPGDVSYEHEGMDQPKNDIPGRGDARSIWDHWPGSAAGDAGPTDNASTVYTISEVRLASTSSGNADFRMSPEVSQHQHVSSRQNLSIGEFAGDLSHAEVHTQSSHGVGASTDDGLPRFEDLELG